MRYIQRGQFKNCVKRGIINESIRSFTRTTITTVFISHSHKEYENGDLEEILSMLKYEYNVETYIDAEDSNMPSKTCGRTAERLESIIEKTDKFILLASNEALKSCWCNWEVGYADGKKRIDENMAIMPIESPNDKFKGHEYLSIYPCIKYDELKQNMFVIYKDKILSLNDWLNDKRMKRIKELLTKKY